MSSYHHYEQTLAHLPQPDVDEIRHSEKLIEQVVEKIQQQAGVISFRDYMDLLLYAPGLGYYSAGLAKLGGEGDFVTAPEISSLFGGALANQCRQLFDQGCSRQMLEFGAGSGKLCQQILAKLDDLQQYFILELSADLRQRQQVYLKAALPEDLYDRIHWLDNLPAGYSGIIVTNEVLDAMPVNRVEKNGQWVESGVAYEHDRFVWKDITVKTEAIRSIESLESRFGPFENGYTTEINLNYLPWFKALSEACRSVAVLLIDYGYEAADYYHPHRQQGTLLCHYRHRVHSDPLIFPGLQDITASVDFDAVADAAETAGFDIVGLTSQRQFLLGNGLLEEAELKGQTGGTLNLLDLAQQIKKLTLPDEMGEKFKVIALKKGLDVELPVFRVRR